MLCQKFQENSIKYIVHCLNFFLFLWAQFLSKMIGLFMYGSALLPVCDVEMVTSVIIASGEYKRMSFFFLLFIFLFYLLFKNPVGFFLVFLPFIFSSFFLKLFLLLHISFLFLSDSFSLSLSLYRIHQLYLLPRGMYTQKGGLSMTLNHIW